MVTMIYIGADHRGFELKEAINDFLKKGDLKFEDLGDQKLDPNDDYPIFAEKVARAIVGNPESRGIVICGSGAGVDMVANKIDGIRCALAFDLKRAREARSHDDANMIALPADVLDKEEAIEMVEAFLNTPFSGEERHERRVEEIEKIEKER